MPESEKPTILLIEDDPHLGSAMVKLLQLSGYVPTLCATGADALAAAERCVPDAVVTDVHLPDFNGLVLSQKLREKFGADVPIIVLSGDTSTEVLKSLSHVGATYFLNKPVNYDLLKERLSKYLHAASE